MLLLGSRLLLTHTPGTHVEVDLDAVLSCNLAKKFLNLECFSSASRGRRGLRLNDGLLDEFHRILICGSLGTLERLGELDGPAFLKLSQLLRCVLLNLVIVISLRVIILLEFGISLRLFVSL